MNYKLKRVFAVLFVIIIVAGWYLTLVGAGPIQPLKDRMKLGLDVKGGVYVVMEAKTDLKGDDLREAMEQTQAVIEERVNQMGLAEPVVTIEGEKRIRVELPGAEDAQEAIDQIGRTAQLQFALADGTIVLDGGNVKDATIATDNESAGYAVALEFDSEGSDLFHQATSQAYSGAVTSAIEGVDNKAIMIILDGQIISAPRVNEPISGGQCSITGGFSQEEASNLAALIRGGALPLELEEINSSVQSAKIGYNALEMSVYAGIIGLAIILIIMLVAYRAMGIAADLALLLYVIIVLNIMSAMGSVLTLPGIAGIILSVGMAVDANVVIFSRIREEIESGKTVRVAVQTGFKRAMKTVVDSQVTTLIAAVILYQIGTSAVKGFAFTFMIGIIVSIFTAVVVTQLYVGIISESRKFSKRSFFGIRADNTAVFTIRKELHFIRHRKVFYIISVIILVAGLVFGLVRGLNYGIDFTGGTMIQMDMGKQVKVTDVEKAIKKYDLSPEIIYSGEDNEQIVIRTIESLDSDKRAEVIETINQEFGTTDDDVVAEELFGPSVGKELRNNAILAILIASICMLIYIRFRFSQWKFGGAALLGVVHDVLIVIAFYAIFNVTVNNPFIAGILTVVGYSINDTIVIFDRIRENIRYLRKGNTEEIIDKSITQTLGRSLMTSVTTLIVMVPLLIMAGEAIREFVLPLMVGVIAGAYSSITICSPLYYEFARPASVSKYEKEVKKNKKKNKKLKNDEEKK
ncbi:MAG: protein translocase subunit SecD [Lentihominibacter sp.]|nr:protein translocase subunit SecD [Clostridiales bacterium]MDY2680729.1 protein translocase subunit SecD [Lentihominibacter sp.]